MQRLKSALFEVADHISDVIGSIMITVIVAVLFAQENATNLAEYNTELIIIVSSMVLVQLIAPLISDRKRVRRLYVLGFAHIAWMVLVTLSDAESSYVILVNMGLIAATSVWLPYYYIIVSGIVVGNIHLFTVGLNSTDDLFVLAAYAVVTMFLIERSASATKKRKKFSTALAEANVERQRMQSLINSMTDAVVATNEKGTVVLYNGAALDTLNVNASLEHQPLNKFLKLVDSKEKSIDIFKKAQTAKAYFVSRDYRLILQDDEHINLFISIAPVRIGYGVKGEQGYIILLRDITKEKSLEEERDEFISVVSHELRTPITIAEGNISNAQLLIGKSKKKISKDIATAMDDSYKQVVFLADMINDLSTLSRAERGKLQVEPESIDSAELLESLKRDYTKDAEIKGLKLSIEVDKKAAVIVSSRLYVREILQNFITNSIKYTQKGSITVKVSAKNKETVVYEVSDTGIGISKSDQKKLFQKFFRSEDYRTRESGGTGLGLYVTLKLAKLINATVEVESEINKGSTFRITVPNYKK